MTAARTLSLLTIPAVLVVGGVIFVGACGGPLPTEITYEAAPTAADEPSATSVEVVLPSAGPRTLEPAFTPMTVRPALTNAPDVQAALIREYPVLLRDAGIGGAPVVWIHIAESGVVDEARVHQSSGFEALDRAAINVALAMVFTPAMNGDAVTDAWVQIPVRFQAVN
jgi:protein TonB